MHSFSTQAGYHFDVMTKPLRKGTDPALFFVSFHLDNLSRLLTNGRVAGHQMLLAERANDGESGTMKTDFASARLFQAGKNSISLLEGGLELEAYFIFGQNCRDQMARS